MAAESTIVLLPRFTTLVGAGTYLTAPLDVSRFGSAQFQVWRGFFTYADESPLLPKFTIYFEESLDGLYWVQGPSAAKPWVIEADKTKLFSYGFRLRWFRLRVAITRESPGPQNVILTCWAEGLLR
jgi:hypothetical protein